MRYSPVVILTPFALTLLMALAQSAARPTMSGTDADKNGAVAQKATVSSKNAAISGYHEINKLSANTLGRHWPSRKPQTILVFTASEFTSALSNAQPGDTILLSGAINGGRFTTTRSGEPGNYITIR